MLNRIKEKVNAAVNVVGVRVIINYVIQRLIMKFFTTRVKKEDRHIEPRVQNIPTGHPMPPKYEEITLTIQMIGSGDTTKFTTEEIISIVMDRLKEIEPNDV